MNKNSEALSMAHTLGMGSEAKVRHPIRLSRKNMSKLERMIKFLHELPRPIRYFMYLLYALGITAVFLVAIPFVAVGITTAYLYCSVSDYLNSLDIPED